MKSIIAHIGVYVSDIEKVKDFYVKYFNGSANQKYVNNSGFQSYFITFDSGVRLEIMAHKNLMVRNNMDKVNGYSHIAFSLGSEENVKKLTELLMADGYLLLSPLRRTGDGYFESCVADPEGNRVEITV